MAALGKPTLIHMQNSCSQMVIWLLEELNVEYDIRKYSRGIGPAPPELKETHRQGKAPQFITSDGRVITQLSAITLYILRTYDAQNCFYKRDVDDPVREDQLVCLGVADMATKVASKFMFHALVLRSPFFLRPLLAPIRSFINEQVLDPDITAIMEVMEAEFREQQWFMGGDGPTRADFVLRFSVDMVVQSKYVTFDSYPRLAAWLARCNERDAWKR